MKSAENMTERELRSCRKKWHMRMAEYRAKQKQAECVLNITPPASPTNQREPPAVASSSGHRNRVRINRNKLRKDMEALRVELEKSRREVSKYKKRWQRSKSDSHRVNEKLQKH